MSFESDLFTAITGNAGLAALIGTRLVPDDRSQELTVPCVAYLVVSTPRTQVFGSTQAVAVSKPRIQFSCWGLTKIQAKEVCAALRTALLASGYVVTLANEYDVPETDTNYARRNLDAFIGHVGE